jgi:23S rRNA (cytidine2498-2'-O)-methyltransferase
MQPLALTGYLAPEGFEADLAAELGDVEMSQGRLLFAPGPPRAVAWVENVWFDPIRFDIASIADAAKRLRAIQRNWAGYSYHLHRRAKLIAERLPHVSAKPLVFPAPAPTAPLGSWTLEDETTVIAAARCSSAFANGAIEFVEDREGPPSRAYLKLWEALTLLGTIPKPGETAIDLGASPGGWTWALAKLGCRVIAIDKAPLEPRVAAMPGVEVRRDSAFAVKPGDIGRVDWLFSDVVCYPERLLRLVRAWIDAGLARRLVCTIKFQGETDMDAARAFAAIPGSRLLHLHHNKHELTWMRTAE